MTPTPQQEAIYAAIEGDSGHAVVEALAGTGKTTTAVECARRFRGKDIGFVAFNKHIAGELQKRLPASAEASTMHSAGFASLRQAFGKVELDGNKAKNILFDIRPQWTYTGKRGGRKLHSKGHTVLRLVSLCKYTLTDPNDTQALAGLIDHFAIEPPSRARETTKSLCSRLGDCGADIEVKGREILIHKAGSGKVPGELVDEIRLHDDDMVAQVAGEAKALSPHVAELLERCAADTRRIDFDDMIWLPVHLNLPVRRKSLLLVDEAQDLNRCQQALVKRIGEEGRIVPIGDRWQSLYAFTGADPEALPRLSGELETSSKGSKSYPLTVTWRCPVSHVRLARRIVPDLQAAPNAGEGTVGSIGDDDLIGQIEAGDMVISRRNAPLVSLAMKLAAFSGVGIVLRGRDIGKSLQVLIDDLATGTPKELIKALKKYQEKELDRLDAVEASEDAIESLMDRVACLVEIASRCDSIGDIARRISDVFGDDDQNTEGKVVLSSVHRAKGLEANRVFIIDTGCLPMIRSCRRCGGKGCPSCDQRGTRARPWQVQTELNLAYVAVTRAKRELYFVGDTPALFGGSF